MDRDIETEIDYYTKGLTHVEGKVKAEEGQEHSGTKGEATQPESAATTEDDEGRLQTD